MNVLALVFIVGLSAQAVTVLHVLTTHFPAVVGDPTLLPLVGVGALVGVVAVAHVGVRLLPGCRPSLLSSLFVLCTWTSLVDACIVASLLRVSSLADFYLERGEPYFRLPWGLGCLAWDSSAHYLMQVYLAYALITRRTLSPPVVFVGLLWAGSILNSMPVLLLGAATGPVSDQIEFSTALNAPYVVVPACIARYFWVSGGAFLDHRRHQARRSLVEVGWRVVTVAFHSAALVFHAVRAMAALGSRAGVVAWWNEHEPCLRNEPGFEQVQIVQFVFYFVPWHILALCEAVVGRPLTASTVQLAAMAAGAYGNAEFSYLVGVWLPHATGVDEPPPMRLPVTMAHSVITFFPLLIAVKDSLVLWSWDDSNAQQASKKRR